jgi:hypothetical protein
MTAHREIKHIDWLRDTPVRPHSRRDAAAVGRKRIRDHFSGADVLGIRVVWVGIGGKQGVFHDEGDRRVVGRDDRSGPHHLPEVHDQRTNKIRRSLLDVQERAAGGRPTTRRKEILLAVDRNVVAVLRNRDLGGDAGVEPVAFNQALRARRRHDATFRELRAGVLGNEGDPHAKRDWDDLKRLELIVANECPLPVLRAVFLLFGNVELHFVAGQVRRKLFVAGLASLLAARVPSHLLLFRRIGDPFSRVDDIGRVTEVKDELLGVGQVSLDLLAESHLESEVSLRLDLRDLGLLFFELPVLLFDESILRAKQPVAGLDITWIHGCR